jgi:hypothetical protein
MARQFDARRSLINRYAHVISGAAHGRRRGMAAIGQRTVRRFGKSSAVARKSLRASTI